MGTDLKPCSEGGSLHYCPNCDRSIVEPAVPPNVARVIEEMEEARNFGKVGSLQMVRWLRLLRGDDE